MKKYKSFAEMRLRNLPNTHEFHQFNNTKDNPKPREEIRVPVFLLGAGHSCIL